MDISVIKTKTASLFEAYPEVGIAYLFGSQAGGATGPLSDYDFAVYFDEKDAVRRHTILFRLSADIMAALNTDAIDIHSLNDIDQPELKYSIIAHGVVLFEREPYRLIIEPRILNEYFDFVYLLKKHGLTKAYA